MRTLVTCFSQTGNTRKVAGAIAGALPGDVPVTPLADAVPGDADVTFVGLPVVRFGAPEQVRAFLQERCRGRRVALFITHAAPEDAPELQPWLEACREAAEGCDVVGLFHCQGQLAEPVRQYMLASDAPDLMRFAALADDADGQPDEVRLQAARRFAGHVVDDLASAALTAPVAVTV